MIAECAQQPIATVVFFVFFVQQPIATAFFFCATAYCNSRFAFFGNSLLQETFFFSIVPVADLPDIAECAQHHEAGDHRQVECLLFSSCLGFGFS